MYVCAVGGVRVCWPGQMWSHHLLLYVFALCDIGVCWPGQVWRLWSHQLLFVSLCSAWCQGVLARTSVEIVESLVTVCVFVQCMVSGCVGQDKCGDCGVISYCCVCSAWCHSLLARTSVEIVELISYCCMCVCAVHDVRVCWPGKGLRLWSHQLLLCVCVQWMMSGCVGQDKC